MDVVHLDGAGGKGTGNQQNGGTDEDIKNKKTSAYILGARPLANCMHYNAAVKAKVRKSKSDHGGASALIEASISNQHEKETKKPHPAAEGSSRTGGGGGNTNVGHSNSFNDHYPFSKRRAKKSAVGMGLANMHQQIFSATMFGVVLGGDSEASQQVLIAKYVVPLRRALEGQLR